MGSGRTGSLLACRLAQARHDVSVIDWSDSAFDRLPDDFSGRTILGNAVDQDILRAAGIETADAFVAATSGDNRNIMAAQIAAFLFRVPKVIVRIKDPDRAEIFGNMGLQVDCRTTQGAKKILEIVGDDSL